MKFNTKKLAKTDVVSFDIFDTLLVRNVPRPENVFDLVEKKSGIIGFAEKRKKAAELASGKVENGEATLKDIYNCIEEKDRERLLELELDTEKDVLVFNTEIRKLYDWCKSNGKIIIAVSDMYLPSEFLRKCLEENGYKMDRIFVSCEVKENKRTGGMFDYVSHQYRTKNIIHIGDSIKSDYLSPIKHGWKSYRYNPKKHSDSFIESICKNYLYNDYFENLGFKVLGPMIYCFSKWLKEKSQDVDSLIFFSRDGMIMREAFKKISDRKTSYAYVSRQSLNTAALWMHPEFNELSTSIIVTRNFTVIKFVKRIGLSPNSFNYEIYGIDSRREYSSDEFWKDSKIKSFYEDIKDEVISNSKKQYKLLFDYIGSEIQGSKIGIVDIGWKGTMQKRLAELLTANSKYRDCKLHGFYLGIEYDAEDVDGFLYQSEKQTNYKTTIDAGFGLVETLFLAREGSTI